MGAVVVLVGLIFGVWTPASAVVWWQAAAVEAHLRQQGFFVVEDADGEQLFCYLEDGEVVDLSARP